MKIKMTLVIAVAFALVYSAVAYGESNSNQQLDAIQTITTIQSVNNLKNMHISLKNDTKLTEHIIVDKDIAIENAREKFPAWAEYATSVTTEYFLLTDPDYRGFSEDATKKNPKLKEVGYMLDQPAYIVTYKGLSIEGHIPANYKGKPPVNHEYNVVVDAATGEPLFGFSYR